MKELNVNSIIKVKLNDYGREILCHQHDELNRWIINRGGEPLDMRFPETDEHGYSSFQLHDFMYTFGKCFTITNTKLPIKNLSFYIEDKDLYEVEI